MAQVPLRPAGHRRDAARQRRRVLIGLLLGLLLVGSLATVGMAFGPFPPGAPRSTAQPTPSDDTSPQAEPSDGAPLAQPPSPAPRTSSSPPASAPPRKAGEALPFDLPALGELRRSERMVFAHYFTPYPLSLDNQPASNDYYSRNYLTPGGEKGKHAAYGGLLRDRPLPVTSSAGDWQQANLQREVRTARAAGIDGFTVDILSLSGANWDRVTGLMRAARSVDPAFRIVLMPDMTSLHADAATIADSLAALAEMPSAYRLGDGRLVVSPFKAEARPPVWWSQLMDRLQQRHGIATALVPLFLNLPAYADQFAPISHGFSEWGSRSHTGQDGAAADARLAHGLGKLWMQPVSVQDARPNQGIYDEAGNTATLRSSWQHAISDGADWVQLTTWNDYSEGSHFSPSLHNGYAYLDLSSYYLTRFKTGAWPEIVRDTLYLTSRVQPAEAVPTQSAGLRLMLPREGTAQPRDTVEVLSFLTAEATVHATVGDTHHTYRAPPGLRSQLFPLKPGHSSAAVTRAGGTVTSVALDHAVRSRPAVQDLQYYAATSGRRGSGDGAWPGGEERAERSGGDDRPGE